MIYLDPTWKAQFQEEFTKPYFERLLYIVKYEYQTQTVYPPLSQIFAAFNAVKYDELKVVILGQDPYYNEGQANGLAFSTNKGQPLPSSLLNIIKELKSDVGIPTPLHGDLSCWAQQGVLLLNTVLTVRQGKPASHRGIGWEEFTDTVIKKLNEHPNRIIYLLWGKDAQAKMPLIDTSRHFCLCAPHPSPLSAHRGFFGCKHFSKVNQILTRIGQKPIDWQIK